jgi:6-pyruvoyltetrahydropterin 2'-reductase
MINYSEIFFSVQGEGHYTGVPTAWLRFFLCNLQCNGFGQKDPTNPLEYVLPYEDLDVSKYKTMEDLPVFEYGCDSSYSWAKKFKGLTHTGNTKDVAQLITDSMRSPSNPYGSFLHPGSNFRQHMCFTGGEPLMKHGQYGSIDILKVFEENKNIPGGVTYETNGTQPLTKEFIKYWDMNVGHEIRLNRPKLFFSISPKLWSVAGENATKAIKPEIVKSYHNVSKTGQLKFVLTPNEEAWDELDEAVRAFRDAGVNYPVWIMPVGATVEGQKIVDGEVARMAFKRGYCVAARVHTYLWGNLIGV